MASSRYYYGPTTPPSSVTAAQFPGSAHSRTSSGSSSVYTNNSSPETAITNNTTPSRSPAFRQRGPTLLPKIRPQDIVVEPVSRSGPYRHCRALSSSLNPSGFVPYPASRPSTQRPAVEAIDCSLISPVSPGPIYNSYYAGSTLTSPVTHASSQHSIQSRRRNVAHSRPISTASYEEDTCNHYATYQQPPPRYVTDYSPMTPLSAVSFTYPTDYGNSPYLRRPQNAPAPQPYSSGSRSRILDGNPPYIELTPDRSTTTLLRYLTSPTQAVHLVRNVAYPMARMGQTFFWWDVRNLRRWSSFSLDVLNSIPNLTKLLTTEISDRLTPPTGVNPSRLSPESEIGLANVIRDIYAPRVNAALRISQGRDCLSLNVAPDAAANHETGPHFLANYAIDTERTAAGNPRGRVVGLVKSFDRWNTGMRNEQPHRRVEYLNGLAHLQNCMREHSCRYGFIMTEIELVCVRAGCDEGDDVPYFGYLELATPIATKTSSQTYNPCASVELSRSHSSSSAQSSDYSSSSRGSSPAYSSSPLGLSAPFTATVALYYLLMLAKSVPLPGQPGWHLNVGGPGALTRQRDLPEGKDRWIPEPQLREKRDAKRVRGWVWPHDAWHRREGGGASRSKTTKTPTAKRWHK